MIFDNEDIIFSCSIIVKVPVLYMHVSQKMGFWSFYLGKINVKANRAPQPSGLLSESDTAQ